MFLRNIFKAKIKRCVKKVGNELHCGIDLHSNNNSIIVIDENDKRIIEKKLPNEFSKILMVLKPYQEKLAGIMIESTYNWYWLVDASMDEGFKVCPPRM